MTARSRPIVATTIVALASATIGVAAATVTAADTLRACRGSAEPPTPPVRADIDGDGRRDSVKVIAPKGACPVLIVVGSRVGTIRTTLRQTGLDQVWPEQHSTPFVGAAATIDRVKGAEIAVAMDWAAPTTFYGIFTVRGRRLVRYRVADASLPDTFSSGGPPAFGKTFDCLRPGGRTGEIITSGAEWRSDGGTKGLGQTLYRVRQMSLVPIRSTTTRKSSPHVLGRPLLSRCAVAYGGPHRR